MSGKPRLVKINKKVSPKSTSSLHENQASDVEQRRCKSKCEKTRTSTNTAEGRISGWRLKKSMETVQKKTRRAPKRIPATHNFVYEFNPLGNPSNVTRGVPNLPNIGQGDSLLRSTSGKQNFSNVQTTATIILPKLHLHYDITENLMRQENTTNYGKNVTLPNIKRQEMGVEQRLVKSQGERRKRIPVSDIDREVEKVKSDWKALRTDGGWTQSKNFASTRSRKLYSTLEKMNEEIDKMQKTYLDPKSNQFLRRGAMKVLDSSPFLSFEEKTDKIKEMLFPNETKKMVDETLNDISNDLLNEIPSKDMRIDRQFQTKPSHSNIQLRTVKSATKLNDNLPLNFNRQNTGLNNRLNVKKINSDIETYLDKYINDADKNFVNKKESKIKEIDVSSADVTEMLKKLNLNSFDIYNIDDDCKDSSSLQSGGRIKFAKDHNSVQATMNEQIENMRVTKEAATENLSSNKDDYLKGYNNVLNSDTSIQTNFRSIGGDNVFIEMGLHALNDNFSQKALTRVLHSQYLKKDASLKPM
ncbi:hypothetical protein ANTQUA_LOCUS6460 [Anthophora quadrimaculata]